MDVRRKEPETRVLDRELTTRLGDAALAQNQRLPAFGQCLTNDGPFLERIIEHPALPTALTRAGSLTIDYGPKSLSLVGSRRIKSCTAARGSLSSYSMR